MTVCIELYDDTGAIFYRCVQLPDATDGPLLLSATRDLALAYIAERNAKPTGESV